MAAAAEEDLVTQVRAIWAAYARGGFQALREVVGPDVEWVPLDRETPVPPDEFWGDWARQQTGRVSVTVHGFEAHGPCVLAHGSLRTFRDGGFVDVQPSWVYFFKDRRLIRCVGHPTREEALAAIEAFKTEG